MGNLRSVGGWGEVDLDQRAITTEDDIVDLSELDRSGEQPSRPAPARQNGAAEPEEPREGQSPPAASQPHHPPQAPPATDVPGPESDEDFDRWVADRAPALGGALAASKPSTPPLASDARDPASGDIPRPASGTVGVPRDEPVAGQGRPSVVPDSRDPDAPPARTVLERLRQSFDARRSRSRARKPAGCSENGRKGRSHTRASRRGGHREPARHGRWAAAPA